MLRRIALACVLCACSSSDTPAAPDAAPGNQPDARVAACVDTTDDGQCCGGVHPACPDGKACDVDADCASNTCLDARVCIPACTQPADLSACPVYSCLEILQRTLSPTDGVYALDLPEGGSVDAYCDMTTDGGGWTLLDNFGSASGRFGNLAVIANEADLAAHGYTSDATSRSYQASALSFFTPNPVLGSVTRPLPNTATQILMSWRLTHGGCNEVGREGKVLIAGELVEQRFPCPGDSVAIYSYGPGATMTLNEHDTIAELDYLFVR